MAFPKRVPASGKGYAPAPSKKKGPPMKAAPKPKGVAKKMGDQFMEGANC